MNGGRKVSSLACLEFFFDRQDAVNAARSLESDLGWIVVVQPATDCGFTGWRINRV